MKTARNLICFLLIVMCCSCGSNWETTTMEDYTRSGLNSFYASNTDLENDGIDKVIYLIMRDCACVEENTDFLIENVDKLSKDYLLIIRNPQGNDAWKRLKATLDQKAVKYVVDEDLGLMEAHGIIFAEDKVVKFSEGEVSSLTTFDDRIYSPFSKSM